LRHKKNRKMTFNIKLISILAICLFISACGKDEPTTTSSEPNTPEEIAPSFSFDLVQGNDLQIAFPDLNPLPDSFSASWDINDEVIFNAESEVVTFQNPDNGAFWLDSSPDAENFAVIQAIDFGESDTLSLTFLIPEVDLTTPQVYDIASGDILVELLNGLFGEDPDFIFPSGVALPLFDANSEIFPLLTFFGVFDFNDSKLEVTSFDEASNTIDGNFNINFTIVDEAELETEVNKTNILQITNGEFTGVPMAQIQ